MLHSFKVKSIKWLNKNSYIDMYDMYHKNKFEADYAGGLSVFDYEAKMICIDYKRTKCGFTGEDGHFIPTWAVGKFLDKKKHQEYFV